MRLTSLRPVLIAFAALVLPVALFSQATPAEKTAEQEFQNIQVFKGKPANELRPTMSFIASSLGVGCNFCHAQPFSADTKPEKATARKMIEMVYSINQNSFGGRNQVNCYTCHQGHSRPTSSLTIAADMPPGSAMAPGAGAPGGRGPEGRGGAPGAQANGGRGPAANLPAAQAILDKYVAALGGAGALGGIHSESVTADRVARGRTTQETLVRADGKLALTRGTAKSGFDGTQYWAAGPDGAARELASDAIGQMQLDLPLYPAEGLKAEGARVFGKQPVGDRTAYVLAARTSAGVVRYYFDADSGLLLRVVTSTPTYLGSLPLQVDYSDYRDVDGVKLPFDEQWSTHEAMWERKISAVKLNGPVDAAVFQPPTPEGQ